MRYFLLGLLAVSLTVLPAVAQSNPQQTTNRPGYTRPKTQQQGQQGHWLTSGEQGFGTRIKAVPGDYPLPQPPGAVCTLAQTVVSGQGIPNQYVRFEDKHSFEDLVSWYEKSLKDAQWTVQSFPPGTAHNKANTHTISAKRNRGPSASIQITNLGKGGVSVATQVTMTPGSASQ